MSGFSSYSVRFFDADGSLCKEEMMNVITKKDASDNVATKKSKRLIEETWWVEILAAMWEANEKGSVVLSWNMINNVQYGR